MTHRQQRDDEQLFDQAIAALRSLITQATVPDSLSPELKEHGEFMELYQRLQDVRILTAALAAGDLGQSVRSKGYLVGTLKALQANLRHLTWQAKRIADGDLTQRVEFLGDFSEAFNSMVVALDAAQTELQQLAATDALTGLANRRKFFEVAEAEVQRSLRYGYFLSVMMVDIDYFKQVNDTYGHQVGDLVLQAVAAALNGQVRDTDLVGRIGGEEFCILLPDTPLKAALNVGSRLLDATRQLRIPVPDHELEVTVSIGLTDWTRGDQEIATIMERADIALYQAKTSGRNRLVVVSG